MMASCAQPLSSAGRSVSEPMDWEQLHDDLQRVLEDLSEKNRHAPIIVEGEYDKRSLRALGVTGDIRPINQGSTVFGLCELIAAHHREAIILTDWDVRGGRLARQLRDALSANGVRFDEDLRARLTRLCRKDITDVESLHAFVERVAERASVGYRQRPSKRWYAEQVQKRDTRRRSQK